MLLNRGGHVPGHVTLEHHHPTQDLNRTSNRKTLCDILMNDSAAVPASEAPSPRPTRLAHPSSLQPSPDQSNPIQPKPTNASRWGRGRGQGTRAPLHTTPHALHDIPPVSTPATNAESTQKGTHLYRCTAQTRAGTRQRRGRHLCRGAWLGCCVAWPGGRALHWVGTRCAEPRGQV